MARAFGYSCLLPHHAKDVIMVSEGHQDDKFPRSSGKSNGGCFEVNLSGIPKSSLLGRLIRYPLRFIPKDAAVPILQGRFKGKKWIVGSANHGYWLGSYEFKKRLLFERTIPPGSVVYDVGGFVGYYTLLASVLVGQEGRVVVFEPLPRNLYYLKEHLRLNRITNVTVVEAAVSDQVGTLSFKEGPSRARGKLAEDGGLQVQAVRLDDLVESGELPEPQYMKVDVEGAELRAFAGAQRLMERCHPTLFLDTHGSDLHAECCRWLAELGYRLETIDGKDLPESKEIFAVYEQGGTHKRS
jgi:FkbM family methyltransferase